MTMQAVAETYAAEHGLQYLTQKRVPSPASRGRETEVGAYVIEGSIAGTRPGMLYQCAGGRAIGPPTAQFEVPGLGEVIDGLCVLRSGRNLFTRGSLPKKYIELKLPDAAYMAKYRVAIASRASEEIARRLLDPDFTEWHLADGPQGGAMSQAGGFEISGGRVFVRGGIKSFASDENLDAFAVQASALATRVAALVQQA